MGFRGLCSESHVDTYGTTEFLDFGFVGGSQLYFFNTTAGVQVQRSPPLNKRDDSYQKSMS